MNHSFYIILPGIEYKADGPLWVDKLQITASINNARCGITKITSDGIDTKSSLKNEITLIKDTDFDDIVSDDNVHKIIQTGYSETALYENTEGLDVHGLIAMPFIGSSVDTCIFTINLYTRTDWTLDGSLYKLSNDEPTYALIDTINIKYNPFISLSTPPQLTQSEWVNQIVKINHGTVESKLNECLKITSEYPEKSYIYFDKQINLCVDYDELPIVNMVNTDPAYKCSFNSWIESFVNDDRGAVPTKLPLVDSWTFLPFRNGKGLDDTCLSACAHIKSISGSVAHLRFTIIGAQISDFKLEKPITIKYEASYDFSILSDFKYFTSTLPQLTINISPKDSQDTFTIQQPDELSVTNNEDNTLTLRSGCSWKPVLDEFSNNNLEDCTYDVWRDYSQINKWVWTAAGNRGANVPDDTVSVDATIETTTCLNINSKILQVSPTQLKGTTIASTELHTLKNVHYLTFVDNSYEKRKLSDLVYIDRKFPNNPEYILVKHVPTTITISKPKVTPNLQLACSTQSNYLFIPYFTAHSIATDGSVCSYPIADSSNGGIKVSDIIAHKIETELDDMPFTGSLNLALALLLKLYKCAANTSIPVTMDKDDIPDGLRIIIKYTQINCDEDHQLKWDRGNFQDSFIICPKEGTIITITPTTNCLIGGIAAIKVDANIIYEEDKLEKIDFAKLSLVHAIGSYEDVSLFGGAYKYVSIYLPPPKYFCVGFYKITSESKINSNNSDFKLLYNFQTKNEIIKNLINNALYRRTSV